MAQWQRTGLLIQGLRVQVSPGEITIYNIVVGHRYTSYFSYTFNILFDLLDTLTFDLSIISSNYHTSFIEFLWNQPLLQILAGNHQSIIYHLDYM